MVERSLGRLAGLVSQRRRTVFVVWVALLAAGGWFSLHQSDYLSGGGWEVPGSPSLQVADALQKDWPNAIPPAFTVLITRREAGARAAAVQRLVAAEPNVRPERPFNRRDAVFLPLAYLGKSS